MAKKRKSKQDKTKSAKTVKKVAKVKSATTDKVVKAKAKATKVKKAKAKKPKPKKVKSAEFVSEFARLARLMRAAEHEIGLNPAQWEALRFLARCNSVSNSPIALTRYLGATKGTISQTVIALVNKGLVEKTARAGARRSVVLTVTERGKEFLNLDPWNRVEKVFAGFGPGKKSRLMKGVADLLSAELEERSKAGMSAWDSAEFFGTVKKTV